MEQKLKNFLNSDNYIEKGKNYKAFYDKERRPHRLDGPAWEWSNGSKFYYHKGELLSSNKGPIVENGMSFVINEMKKENIEHKRKK